jgi:branched-chain amino acid transport system permease protein
VARSVDFWISQLFNGAALGAVLFLVGSGFSMIMGLMRIVNLAHGAYYLLGAYVAIAISQAGGNFWLAVVGGAVPILVLGVLMERFVLRYFHRQELVQVLLTIGFWLVLSDFMLWIWGGDARTLAAPTWLQGSVVGGDVFFPKYRIFLIVAGLLVLAALWLFESRTKLGAVVRAGADDEEMVRGLGININRVFVAMFGLGALLAGLGGALGGPFLGAYPGLDHEVLLYAVVVVIVGGRGSIVGAGLGALMIGVAWNASNALVPDLAYFTLFAPLALFLAFRPQGLLGKT